MRGPNHGVACETPAGYTPDNPIPLPDVPLESTLTHHESTLRFYEAVLPRCSGINSNWNFDIHAREFFRLNADYEEEYVLHISNVSYQETHRNFSRVLQLRVIGFLIKNNINKSIELFLDDFKF